MPILAEVADKVPTLEAMCELWIFIGLFTGGIVAALSLLRPWVGGIMVVLSAAFGLLTVGSDGIMDPQIVYELGTEYLLHQRFSGFLPFVLALVAWGLVLYIRRPNIYQARGVNRRKSL
jgi:hypothetical protein